MYKQNVETTLTYYILFSLMYLLYLYDNRLGIILSIFGLLTAWRLKYTDDNYSDSSVLKAYLILSFSLIIYLTVTNTIPNHIFNSTATGLLMINIFILIFTFDSINRKRFCLILTILFIVITTPILKYKNNKISLGSNIIDKDLWVILQSIILGIFYLTNQKFRMNPNIHLILFSLFAPAILHFTSNDWLVSRALFLNLFIMIDTFN